MNLNPYLVWPLAIAVGASLALAFWVIVTDATALDAAGYFLAAVGGVVIGKLTEARHPAHFGPEAK